MRPDTMPSGVPTGKEPGTEADQRVETNLQASQELILFYPVHCVVVIGSFWGINVVPKVKITFTNFKAVFQRLAFVLSLIFPFILALPFSLALLDNSQRKSSAFAREFMFRKLNPWVVLFFVGVFFVFFVLMHKRKIKAWPVTLALGIALSSTIAGYFSLAFWNYRNSSFSDSAIFAITGIGVYVCYVAVLRIVKN